MQEIAAEEWEKRLKDKYPMLQYFTSRPFGVEIEVFGLRYTISPADGEIIPPYKIMNRSPAGTLLVQEFQRRGLNLNGFSRDEPAYQAWSFVTDDTIKGAGGSELVSPILSGVPGLTQVYQTLLLLQQFPEIQVNETCGLHVHHGVEHQSFGPQELRQLVRLVSIFEDYIFCLLPPERRQAEACRPMEIDVEAWLKAEGADMCSLGMQRLWYTLENRDDPEIRRDRKYHPTRYHGLNLHSYWYRGTVEFRYFPSLLDHPEDLMQWIIFTQFLVEWSAGRQPELEFIPQANKWLTTLYKMYLVLGKMSRIRFPGHRQTLEERR
jgi:hypothetical protein